MLKGSLVALVTPMLESGDIDYPKLEKLIDFHVDQGTNGLVIAGTTGESATLDFEEHCEFLNQSREIINQRLPMIAGSGANSTKEAIHLTDCALQARADAALLVTPYYNKPTQEGLYQHHKAIAEAVAIDQLLYNVPGRTACDMLPETVQRLAQVPNIIGIKEATGDLQRLAEIQDLVDDAFVLLSGDDATTRQFILQGGHGTISVTANVAPAQMAAMCAAAAQGEAEEALRIDQQIEQLHKVLFVEANPIPVKWAVSEMGLCGPTMRLPMTPLSSQYHAQLRQALKDAGVL
ncbi:MAG: 4-hydroxy-tetrahydrodipicolinate synthase [Gammaproteobacteria bacterium]|nr:4-hydroxy-tetrahydrodipicolinate synthase [Gammaproteobacteria bacterium]